MGNKIHADFSSVQEINIGIKEKDRRAVCKELGRLLADTYMLYLKTQNYHWNVTGPLFQSLHQLFEEQYTELASSVDVVAERIRALGEFVPASFASFSKITAIKEEGSVPSTEEMIHNLVLGNELVASGARDMVSIVEEAEDDVTADLLVERMRVHEKNAWMLRSLLPNRSSGHSH